MARKVSCVNSAKLATRYKVTNCDINYTRMFQILLETAPYRQWIIVTPRVPSPTVLIVTLGKSPTVLVPYTVVKYEYSYRKVLYLPY